MKRNSINVFFLYIYFLVSYCLFTVKNCVGIHVELFPKRGNVAIKLRALVDIDFVDETVFGNVNCISAV